LRVDPPHEAPLPFRVLLEDAQQHVRIPNHRLLPSRNCNRGILGQEGVSGADEPLQRGLRKTRVGYLRQKSADAPGELRPNLEEIAGRHGDDGTRKLLDYRNGIARVCQACLEDRAGRKDDACQSERLRTAAPNAPQTEVDERKQCGGDDRDDDLRRHEELAR
jgi:hypothetical protein